MVGNSVKHVLNMKNTGGAICDRRQTFTAEGQVVSYKKLKSLKKLVREQNNNMEEYSFKNFYGQTFFKSGGKFFKNRSNS